MNVFPVFPNSVVSNDIDFITEDDPSAYLGLTYLGQSAQEMPGNTAGPLVMEDVYVFEMTFVDGTSVEIFADARHSSVEDAAEEAMHFAGPLGKLPAVMREDLSHVVLNIGDAGAFAESQGNFFVVTTGNMAVRRANNDMEETIFHEAVHATLDETYLTTDAWLEAQVSDGVFITDYAEEIPNKEDFAETALFAYTFFFNPDRLPPEIAAAMTEEIPARLAVFEDIYLTAPTAEDLIAGSDEAEILEGTEEDDLLDALGGDDIVRSGDGSDTVTLGAGADVLQGRAQSLYGDTVTDFTASDAFVFEDLHLGAADIAYNAAANRLEIDDDGDGTADGAILLSGDFSTGAFLAAAGAEHTTVAFVDLLPDLAEAVRFDPATGADVDPLAYLTAGGQTGYRITLDPAAQTANHNALGVYEITPDGQIVDVRILVADTTADPLASVAITDIEAGHELGFFVVLNGADWLETAEADSFSFVDAADGGVAQVDDAHILLAVDGLAAGQTVLHSAEPGLNPFDLTHAVTGAATDGTGLMIGFEDTPGGGDRDYQDVVFSVTQMDLI